MYDEPIGLQAVADKQEFFNLVFTQQFFHLSYSEIGKEGRIRAEYGAQVKIIPMLIAIQKRTTRAQAHAQTKLPAGFR